MSWLTKQFRSFKKAVIPRELRSAVTRGAKAVIPNEVTGVWDDAMEGSKQLGEKIGFGGIVQSDHTKREQQALIDAANATANEPVTRMPDMDELQRLRRRAAQRRQGLGRASTVLGGGAETLG